MTIVLENILERLFEACHLGQDQRSWSLSRDPIKMDPGSARFALDRDDKIYYQ